MTVTSINADAVLSEMSTNNGNSTGLVPGTSINDTVSRVGVQIQTDIGTNLPRLWIFVLAILAGVLALILFLSAFLNIIQYFRRKALLRRIRDGQVDLEILGVKRLTVPPEILSKMPIRVYTLGQSDYRHTHAPNSEGIFRNLYSRRQSNSNNNDHKPKTWFKFDRPDSPGSNPSTPSAITSDENNEAAAADPNNQNLESSTGYSQTGCPICLEEFVEHQTQVRELPCLHIYHMECIDPFLTSRSSLCPLCKTTCLPKGYIPPSLKLTNATVRREREMRLQVARGLPSYRPSFWERMAANANENDNDRHGRRRSHHHQAQESIEFSTMGPEGRHDRAPHGQGGDEESAVPSPTVLGHINNEALAVSQEEEDAQQRQRPGWRRVLGNVFPRL